MKALALLTLCGCSQIFGLNGPTHGTVIDGATDSIGSDAAPLGCTTIADCPTSVCLPNGTCAADSDVAWLVQGATATTPCSMATPCYRMGDALATLLPYVRVHGSVTNVTSVAQDVSFFGEFGASLGQAGYNIGVQSGNVRFQGLSFGGSCFNQNGASTLTLAHDTINGCNNLAINSTAGALVIDRTTITNNRNGGIRITAAMAQFAITNSVIAGNNNQPMSDTGGINIQSTVIAPSSRLDFNTIVNNGVKNGTSTTAGGVTCDVAGFAASSNIISENNVQGSTTVATANTAGACTFPSSIIEADDTNLALTADFHLGAGSVAIDAAMTPPIIDHDIDADHRPQGMGYDIGADEYP